MSAPVIKMQLLMALAALEALASRHIASDDTDAAEMKVLAQESLDAIKSLEVGDDNG